MTDHDTKQLALYLNARDSREYGTAAWGDLDLAGQEAYLTDATAIVAAMKAVGWTPARNPTDDQRKLARAMARVEQLSDHLGIPYVYETGHGPVRPAVTPPVYLAADLWDALCAPVADFDAYYERNRWADTWANLLGVVRDRVKPKCGQAVEGETCVLTAGHLPPHYGSSDVGRSEPVPELQGEPTDASVRAALGEWFRGIIAGGWTAEHEARMRAALRAAEGTR